MNSDYNDFVARVALEVVDSSWWKQQLRVKSAGRARPVLSSNRQGIVHADRAGYPLMSHPRPGICVCQIAAEGWQGIDRPTESTHRRFEFPVAMCANSNDWS